jgi:hypothetical protein
MLQKMLCVAAVAGALCVPVSAQNTWSWSHKVELRGDFRYSDDERHPLRFPFPPEFLPPGQTQAFLETPDPGSHVELNVADLQLDLGYGDLFAARVKAHGQALHRRNPTSSDRQTDVDELYLRFGPKPEFLERPAGTSLFLQAGKFPKMERQPIRLLESYGLAATSFNRFEDVQVLTGGTVGRNFYWRLQAANGNPLFFRDPNALAGDNGTPELLQPFPVTKFGSGFPILYNAETEGLFFETDHVQIGEGVGYRWERPDQTLGFDLIVFHYRRTMAQEEDLTGTFYGGDLDLLDGAPQIGVPGLPTHGRTKEEYGARLYTEWHGLTSTAQFTKQNVAGLQREGWELEAGYSIPFVHGPRVRGEALFQSIQPAARYSGLTNRFVGPAFYTAPSVWWQWTKIDAGVRIGMAKGLDLTIETTKHNVGSRFKLNLRETLVTLRWRG